MKISLKIISLALLILMLFVFLSCENKITAPITNEIPEIYTVKYFRRGVYHGFYTPDIVVIRNTVQLNHYIKSTIDYWGSDDYGNKIKPCYLKELEKEYTNSFFKNKFVVLARLITPASNYSYEVIDVALDGTIHILDIEYYGDGFAMIYPWSIFIELPKSYNPKSFQLEIEHEIISLDLD